MSLMIKVLLLLSLAVPLAPTLPARAQTAETAAVITELKPGRGPAESARAGPPGTGAGAP